MTSVELLVSLKIRAAAIGRQAVVAISDDCFYSAILVCRATPALTPCERSLVLHKAQSIWDERDARRTRELEAIKADNEETEIAATAAWIGQKLHDLSPAVRAELVHLIKGMGNNARLERLMGNEDF